MAVICQRDAVKIWPQFSAPTLLVWESWTWAPMICRIQEWSCSLLDWGVHTVHWKLSGQFHSMVKHLHDKLHIRGHWTDWSNKHNKHAVIWGLRWEFALRLSKSSARRSPEHWQSKDFLNSVVRMLVTALLPNKTSMANQMVVNNRWKPSCVFQRET